MSARIASGQKVTIGASYTARCYALAPGEASAPAGAPFDRVGRATRLAPVRAGDVAVAVCDEGADGGLYVHLLVGGERFAALLLPGTFAPA
jgi:hypothetical protein